MGLKRDPKQIVTPYAFEVDPGLLGQPLATPKRRLAALLLDLFFAAILSSLNSGFLIAVLAVYLIHTALRNDYLQVYKRGTRIAFAGLGGLLALVAITAALNGLGFIPNIWEMDRDLPESGEESRALADSLGRRVQHLMTGNLQASGMDSAQIDSIRRAMQEALSGEISGETSDYESPPYIEAGSRADSLVASLRAENERYEDLADSLEDANEELAEQAENPSLMRSLRATAEDVGLTFGWVGFYLVVALAWGNGQTPGKRIMRIKVMRLNGKALSLWYSFERTGGYAAGLATGLLGFLQLYWDRNRQGIHDKIAGTVVVDLRDKRREAARAIRRELDDEFH